jgi:hypothetical protein
MKSFFPFLFLIVFLSCNDNSNDNAVAKRPIKKDTSAGKPQAQNPFAAVDVSPMDISYFPTDYPLQKMAGKTSAAPVMRVIYSRPHRQGRKIFGTLLHYGEPWRLGANEATELELFQPVTIQDKKVAAGRYVLYCIPNKEHWTIVLNKNNYTWGLKPDPAKDVYKFDVAVHPSIIPIEYFTIVFEKTDDGNADLLMTWDEVLVRLPIKI